MLAVIVQHELHNDGQCFFGALCVQIQSGFRLVKASIDLFEDREKQACFAAKVVIDHAIVRLGGFGYLLNAAAIKTVLGEDFDGGAQQVVARSLCS